MPKTDVLFQERDAWGEVQVLEDSHYRILSFAQHDEQSRMLLHEPFVLQHDYTRAMMLVLLFCQPKRMLALGLGGGCLVTAMQRHIAGLNITAVEQRPLVIEIAHRFFYLQPSKRLQVLEQEAGAYLKTKPERRVDIIFSDLYNAEGMDERQLQRDYIADCHRHLKEEGWLVLNCWREGQGLDIGLLAALKEYFVDVRSTLAGSGNWILFAGKKGDEQSLAQLKQQAGDLSDQWGFSFVRALARLDFHSE